MSCGKNAEYRYGVWTRRRGGVGLSSLFWITGMKKNIVAVKGYMLYCMRQVSGSLGACIAHAPIQEFGAMLTRRRKNRIQTRGDERT